MRCLYPAALVALLAGCGAKTPLEVEPCGTDGGLRECTTVCGAGVQQCIDGLWTACDVPPTRIACSDRCGEGTQTCVDGVRGECEVPPLTLLCETECGMGSQRCVDGEAEPCEVPVAERPCSTECGEGLQRCVDGRWGRCSADVPLPPVLEGRVRDFSSSHPDFEGPIGRDPGIVADRLGSDGKPVYVGGTEGTTSGRANYDQWYRDTPGVNLGADIELPLEPIDEEASFFVFDDPDFFPIDRSLLGNEGRDHNFHFTLEASATFLYQGGEIFRFRGDDDVWVFINRRLAIDLGGVHSRLEATVDLDDAADELGLVLGERYEIHLFFAERHTDQSTFTIETSIADTLRCEE